MSKKRKSLRRLERDLYRFGITAGIALLIAALKQNGANRVNDHINRRRHQREEYLEYEEVK